MEARQAYISSYEPVVLSCEVTEKEIDAQIDYVMKDARWREGDYIVKPALTDGWVQGNITGCSTVEEFRRRLRSDLAARKRDYVQKNRQSLALDAFTDRLRAELDDSEVQHALAAACASFEKELAERGTNRVQYLAEQKMNAAELEERQLADVRLQLRRGMALDLLAEHLGIEEGRIEQRRLTALCWLDDTAVVE